MKKEIENEMTKDQELEYIRKLEKIINTLDSLNDKVTEIKERILSLKKEAAGCSEHPAADK